jgi:tRNA(Ile)-lysidine synthase
MSLTEQFAQHLSELRLQARCGLIAVSGGPDSTVLLDLLVRTRASHGLELVVGHVDHGIHPESHILAEQVGRLAAAFSLPYKTGQLHLGPGASETFARERRYAWLEDVRARAGAQVIFTAHHADDQIETVLMRVLEGSGPAGLAGMAPVQGTIVRPLLPFARGDLLRHLRDVGLTAWADPANQESRHLRSWTRADLLPFLRRRVPRVDSHLHRVARQASADRAAWDAALRVLPGLDLRVEQGAVSVAAAVLEDYDSALRQAIVQALARTLGCTLGPTRVRRVLDLLESHRSGAQVPLGSAWTAELAFGRLRLFAAQQSREEAPWTLASPAGEGVWGRWSFRWELGIAPSRQGRGGASAWFTLDPLTVRGWMPGEKLTPLGANGRRLVVRCFQEGRVPRSRRASWPVLTQGGELIWIPGLCRAAGRLPAPGTQALRVDADYA